MYKKNEIFPKRPAPCVERLIDYPNFGAVLGEKTVRHFCLYMEDDVIKFQKREMTQAIRNTFSIHGREAKTLKQFRPNDINWNRVINNFARVPLESNRKNADTRTGFKSGSDYLVKAHFTFGLRWVEPGTAHVIQTLDVPLVFYLKDRKTFSKVQPKTRYIKGLFTIDMVSKYDRRILEPRTCYRIPPNALYFIFSTQKNFFRLDMVEENYRIPFKYTDPVSVRVTKIAGMESVYDKPVQTPYIEDDEEEVPSSEDVSEYMEFAAPDPPAPLPAPTTTTTFYLIPTHPPVFETPAPVLETQAPVLETPALVSETQAPVLETPALISETPIDPQILKRNVTVSSPNFLKEYARLTRKIYGNPWTSVFKVNDSFNLKPLDLTVNLSKERGLEDPENSMTDPEDTMDVTIDPENSMTDSENSMNDTMIDPENSMTNLENSADPNNSIIANDPDNSMTDNLIDPDITELDQLIAAATAAENCDEFFRNALSVEREDFDFQSELEELCSQYA